jgi:lipoprotein-anchoring transpeptidase ErfK/SrfK
MIRRSFACWLFALILPLSAQEEVVRTVLRALPVDPSEIPAEEPVPEKVTPAAPVHVAPAKPLAVAPVSAAPIANTRPTGDDAVRLQIFLDQALFGPGVVDGKPGRFTDLAVQAWNEVHGHPADDWTAVMEEARKAVPNPFAVAIVPDVVKEWLDPTLPQDRPGQAKRKRMSYRSVAEFMAERYHTDALYLAAINGPEKTRTLKAQDTVIVPNLQPFAIETLTGKRYEAEASLSLRHVVVDTKQNQVRIFEGAPPALVVTDPEGEGAVKVTRPNRGLIASFPITPGQPKFIRYGVWELKNCLELPHWRYDKSLLETGKRSGNALNIPPGPNSPVGILWAGLSRPGIGMHGTADPETIGRARSAGCIRLANWDAIRLPSVVRPGVTVEIR